MAGRLLRCKQLIAVARIARDISSEPVRRLEIFRGAFLVEFHFSHDQALVFAVVNVDFDDTITERNLVTRLSQPLAFRRRPERVELRCGQLDLTLFAE